MADQLQTNYASDLRHILKDVFECNSSEPFLCMEEAASSDTSSAQSDPLHEEMSENQSENANAILHTADGEESSSEGL